jgi:hypothetical protein
VATERNADDLNELSAERLRDEVRHLYEIVGILKDRIEELKSGGSISGFWGEGGGGQHLSDELERLRKSDASYEDEVMWVARTIDDSIPDVGSCPSLRAWNFRAWVIRDKKNEEKFWQGHFVKLMNAKRNEGGFDKSSEVRIETLEALSRIAAENEKAALHQAGMESGESEDDDDDENDENDDKDNNDGDGGDDEIEVEVEVEDDEDDDDDDEDEDDDDDYGTNGPFRNGWSGPVLD